MSKFLWEKEVEEVDKKRKKRDKRKEDERSLKILPLTNHIGKYKIRSKAAPLGPHLNHKQPKNFTRANKAFTNPLAFLGYSDTEYKTYVRTGKTLSQQRS